MKHFYLALSVVLATTTLNYAQPKSNLTVFAEGGEQFFLYLNGVKQNMVAESNVKVTDLTSESQRAKIEFSSSIPPINKTLYVPANMETTYRIKINKKGEYVLRGFGEPVPLGTATQAPSGGQTVTYNTNINSNTATGSGSSTVGVTTTETISTTTTTTSGGAGGNENATMNVSVGGVDFNMNVNMSGTGMDAEMSETTTTTTTTTTSTTNSGTSVYGTTGDVTTTTESAVAGYDGELGCTWPISEGDYLNGKKAVSLESFADDKMMVAKQFLRNKCVTVDQVSGLMSEFNFEEDKLEFAKYAYDYTYDKGNYYQLNGQFNFSSSKEELNRHISNR